MIALIQRVSKASVCVEGVDIAAIDSGILAFIAIERGDSESQPERLLERILNYRIFPDKNDRMNLSLLDIDGGLLLVPQFTLAADTRKGNRPSFTSAAEPEVGKRLFDMIVSIAVQRHHKVQSGSFGADMKVTLINDGPVTFSLHASNTVVD